MLLQVAEKDYCYLCDEIWTALRNTAIDYRVICNYNSIFVDKNLFIEQFHDLLTRKIAIRSLTCKNLLSAVLFCLLNYF